MAEQQPFHREDLEASLQASIDYSDSPLDAQPARLQAIGWDGNVDKYFEWKNKAQDNDQAIRLVRVEE